MNHPAYQAPSGPDPRGWLGAALRRVAFSAVLLAASCGQAGAQSYAWRNVEIGGGGFVTGTVFHPTEPGLVYARTDVGGAYRLDTTTNRWIALNDDIGGLNNEFQHLGVLTIGLDPGDANRIYLATGQYAGPDSWKLPSRIYRSTNRGATWTYTTPGFKMAGNGEGRGTGERMAVDPLNGANILIGTSDAGIWRSTNSGANWTRLINFPASLTQLNFLLYAPAIAPGPGPHRRVYAAANTLTGQSFWYSDNNGTDWAEVPNHPGKTAGEEMMPLQGSFDAAGVFYSTWADATGPSNYATRYGVWKLSADGNTWTSIRPPTGQGFFAGISADPRVAGHLVVTTLQRWWPGDEVYRSTDGGATWVAALRSGTRSAGNSPWSSGVGAHWMTDIDIDPFNSNRALFNNGFGLIQTTNLSATGTARTWTFFSDGLEELVPLGLHSPTAGPPLVSVVGDYTGFRHDHLDRSPLRGAHNPGSGSTNLISGADLAPSKMIRQNSGTTLYSQDAAVTWAGFPTAPPPVINGQNRVILSTDGQRLLWCPPNAPTYVSNDNGASWTISSNTLSPVSASGTCGVGTLAGAAGVAGTTNATGGSARFSSPSAITLDSSGVRFVVDTANHTIRKISANGAVSTFAGGAGVAGSTDATTTAALFNAPAGIAVDAEKNIFVADTGNHTIRKISSAGVVTTLAGSAGLTGSTDAAGTAARFNSPAGLAVDASGNLYVCDAGNHTIRKITTSGVVTTLAGNPGSSGTTDGIGSAALFNAPNGICLDGSGFLHIADTGNHTIRMITPSGDVTTIAGAAGISGSTDANGTAARFNSPRAIAVDSSGIFHIADTGNHTIRKMTAGGAVTTLAGLAGTSGTSGGTGSAARFNSPSGIAVTPDGFNIYIADTASHTIRRGNPYNTLTPLADRVDGLRFYLWDNTLKRMLTSADGGVSFTVVATGMNTAFNQFRTVPGKNGHLWAKAGASGIHQSTNFGASFTKIAAVAEVYQFDFGKAAPSANHPAIYIWGKVGGIVGFFRSDDTGATWVRINDNLHHFGYQNDIAGDPRVYGRVYLATSGRGVIYGDLTNPPAPAPQPSQVLYDDDVQNGWTNASTGGTSLVSTTPIYRGSAAIAVPAGAGSGVSLTCPSRSLQGLAALAFWINAGAVPPPPLQIGVSRGGISLEAVPLTVPATVGWQRVVVPLAQIGLADIGDLTGLRIESRAVNGIAPGAFSLDDIMLVIRQTALPATGITGWASNISGKVTGSTSASPLLNPNDTTDPYSTNTLQARFNPITLANAGDKITLTGSLQMTLAAVSSQSNWFRFGLYDNRNQDSSIATGWLGFTGMGTSLYERTANGLFSTGIGATQRAPDASPPPVSSTSPSGNPPLFFEVTVTRTDTGVVLTHFIKRTDTNTVLMSYSHTDTTPNNNGQLGTAQSTATGYNPTYNTAGFAFARSYVGTTGAQAQFSNIQVAFTVHKAPASVTLADLTHTYDGSAKSATATTDPAGLPVEITYDGSANAPYQIGSHEVTAIIAHEHYEGSASGTLVIADAHTALENWRFEHFQSYADAGNAANSADPDHDGIVNLMEFALDLDPTLSSTIPATLVTNGGQLEYTYTRSKAALASVSFTVERSDSLAGGRWTTEDISELTPPLWDNGVLQTVKVVLPAGSGHRFVRLRVTVHP